MRKIFGFILLLSMSVLSISTPSTTQESDHAVITPQNIEQLELLQTIGRGKVQDAQWSPDGQWFAVLTSRAVWLYPHNKLTDEAIPLGEVVSPITAFAFHPDNQQIVLGSPNGVVSVWDIETRQQTQHIQSQQEWLIDDLAVSPNGQYVAITANYVNDFNAPWYKNYSYAVIFDLAQERSIFIIARPYREPGGIAFTENSDQLITNFYILSEGKQESAFDLWNLSTLQVSEYQISLLVHGVDFIMNPNGQRFLTIGDYWGSFYYTVVELSDPDKAIVIPLLDEYSSNRLLEFTRSENILLVGKDNQLLYFDIEQESFTGIDILTNEIKHIAANLTKTEYFSVVDNRGIIYHYSSFTDNNLLTVQHFNAPVRNIELTDDNATIIALEASNHWQLVESESLHGNVYIWDIDSETIISEIALNNLTSIAIHPNNQQVAFGSNTGTIYLWDSMNNTMLLNIQAHKCAIRDIVFSQSGHELASISQVTYSAGEYCYPEDTLRIWDITSGNLGELLPPFNLQATDDLDIYNIAYLASDNVLAVELDILVLWQRNAEPLDYIPKLAQSQASSSPYPNLATSGQ